MYLTLEELSKPIKYCLLFTYDDIVTVPMNTRVFVGHKSQLGFIYMHVDQIEFIRMITEY